MSGVTAHDRSTLPVVQSFVKTLEAAFPTDAMDADAAEPSDSDSAGKKVSVSPLAYKTLVVGLKSTTAPLRRSCLKGLLVIADHCTVPTESEGVSQAVSLSTELLTRLEFIEDHGYIPMEERKVSGRAQKIVQLIQKGVLSKEDRLVALHHCMGLYCVSYVSATHCFFTRKGFVALQL